MKKVYEKPSLVMEQFETESILEGSTMAQNAFRNIIKEDGTINGTAIKIGSGQVLQSIDYSLFKKNN